MYYSTKTDNKSFINMWRYLQRNNIENNLFMLQTIRKELVDFTIDKYNSMDKESPSFLTLKSNVIDEVKENIWFYFRELVMVPDDSSVTGYKHFELTPKSMMMIYLYQKNKSFININTDDEICLYFLWNYHKSLYNKDLVLTNSLTKNEEISLDIKKHISHMSCQVPLGSTQAISDGIDHSILCTLPAFMNFYFNKECGCIFIDEINKKVNMNIVKNNWVENNCGIFILEKDIPIIAYSYIISLINDNRYRLYLNGIENKNSMDKYILDNFLCAYFTFAESELYDMDKSDLNCLYLI